MKAEIKEIKIMQIAGLKVHHLAEAHPLMIDDQFQSLKEDIKLNGQLEPVKLFKGKLIDGRHRREALNQLAIEDGTAATNGMLGGLIKYTEVPNNTSLSEVSTIINSTETRRMQSKAQLTAAAFKLSSISATISVKEAARMKGVPANGVTKCRRIHNMMGSDTIDKLIAGEEITITTAGGSIRETASIQFIYNTLGEIAQKEAEHSSRYTITDVDAEKMARKAMKGVSRVEANRIALAMQNRANSIED
jgi:hypothetical protein